MAEDKVSDKVTESDQSNLAADDVGTSNDDVGRQTLREIKLTEKGLEWQISQCKRTFRSLSSTWRTCYNDASILLSDCQDAVQLREGRDRLQRCFSDLTGCFQKLNGLIDISEHDPALLTRMEGTELEHSQLIYSVSNKITSLETDDNCSHVSTHSKHSRASRTSNVSHRSDALLRAAELKAKLKYIDIEAKAKADLERVQTLQQIHIEESKLSALQLDENIDSDTKPDPRLFLPQVDRKTYVSGYLQTHCNTNPDGFSAADVAKGVPDPSTQSMPPADSVQQKHIVTSASDTKLGHTYQTPVSLNPTAASFNPQSTSATVAAAGDLPVTNATIPQTTNILVSDTLVSPHVQNPVLPTTLESPAYGANEPSISDLAKVLAEQLQISRLPPPEPGIFSGDPLKYPAWKSAFDILISSKQVPQCERLYYIKRYVSGHVKDVLDGYLLVSSADAYDEARKLLDERYGNPFTIACAFREKLDKWPKIANRDSEGLVQFSDFLRQCANAMLSIPDLAVLNDSFENRKLLTKLPEWLSSRWNRIVVERRDSTCSFPPFKDFVAFVTKEAKIANDPVTSLSSLKSIGVVSETKQVNKASSRQGNTVKSRTLLSETSDNVASNKSACVLCKKSHDLEKCNLFLRKSLDERKSFMRDKGLCFGCLLEGHISKYCKQRKTCDKCSKHHPTCLHIQSNKPNKGGDKSTPIKDHPSVQTDPTTAPTRSLSGATFFNHTAAVNMCSMIVPVFLSHKDSPNNERLVYALLDTQSDTTFVLDGTCEALGVSGIDVKLSLSTMLAENKVVDSLKVQGLMVRGVDSDEKISLPNTYTRNIIPANRSHIPTPDMARSWPHLESVADHLMPLNECEVGLLIGYNCSAALVPRDIVAPVGDGPYGQRTCLGWSIVGVVSSGSHSDDLIGCSHRILSREVPNQLVIPGHQSTHISFSMRTSVREVKSLDVLRLMEQDFGDLKNNADPYSQEDHRFLSLLEQGITFTNGHYEMPLPFRNPDVVLPNNNTVAQSRLQLLKRRLSKNKEFASHYFEFMEGLLQRGFAERVTSTEDDAADGRIWYLPHHGVYHPQKPGRIRVVFDCSSSYCGESLNSHLLQGPELTNKLVGVICRFRKEPVAITCDVEQMFYQFKVKQEHRNYLRFLWWEGADLNKPPCEYRMTVHIFGATSSPGCANFGLKRIASDHEQAAGSKAADFLRRDFYVDDGLKSLPTVQEAIDLVDKTRELCSRGGLKLHKFASNAKDVLEHLDPEYRAKDLQELDLDRDQLPIERALGISWCIELDEFQFRVTLRDSPLTRRGILSTVGSLYDPLGLISPVVLSGKLILQQMCADKLGWDEPLSQELCAQWSQWREGLKYLVDIKVKRCFKPIEFGQVSSVEFHHFSDASTLGYGQCSYIRLVNQEGATHCSLLMGKSRVAPLKPVTVPRLELSAAVLSVKVATFLDRELDYDKVDHIFWTDSKIVLGYINNEARRFHVFVANRVQQIRESTKSSQWRYVASDENPSDVASRGASARELVDTLWFKGPDFLWMKTIPASKPQNLDLSPDDPELKRGHSFHVSVKSVKFASIYERTLYFSSWHRLRRSIAICLRLKSMFLSQVIKKPSGQTVVSANRSKLPSLSVEELVNAENEIFRLAQQEHFKNEMDVLRKLKVEGSNVDNEQPLKHVLSRGVSSLYKLDPFLDTEGVIRVGGRIRQSSMPDQVKHPVVLPRKCHVTDLVIRHFHQRIAHQGRGLTTNALRSAGFWVIGCSSAVKSMLSKCVTCKRLRYSAQGQKMANLPIDRLEPAPPFTYCAVDLFGPFIIKEGRKELKRYGVLFTCMLCRGIHVETVISLETDSFINCLRRFIAIRGPIRQLRSDRGTNFIGANNELRDAVSQLSEDKVREFLLGEGCDLVEFKMNVPASSHMGGVWERQIRSVRNVIAPLLHNHGSQLDDESLRTFLCEASAIVNSRPLTVDNVNDPQSLSPLSPNQLITMKSSVVLPPPGNFQLADVYSRKRWRRVQYLVDQFWLRWKAEFVQSLQRRGKWNSPKRNVCKGDIILVVEDNHARNQWRLGRIVDTSKGEDGLVRKVKVVLASANLDSNGKRKESLTYLERPIHKVVVIQETEVVPVEEPLC